MTNFQNTYISLFWAALLTAGCLGSAQAFSIVPVPSAASESFVPSKSYELKNGLSGVLTRQPIVFAPVIRGGTEGFLAQLKTDFTESKGWKFLAAEDDLKGSFSVNAYYVFVNGADVSGCGGGFAFDYNPLATDPVAGGNTELHWIQWIVSNHKRGSKHGTLENRIDFGKSGNKKKRPDSPFFDVVSKDARPPKSPSRALPPHFKYDVGKNDPENYHQWSSEVYLASISKNEPKTVTIYNGVSWGWENRTITEQPPGAH